MPAAVSEALRAGTLGRHDDHHRRPSHHHPTDEVFPPSRGWYQFDLGGSGADGRRRSGSGRVSVNDDGGLGAAAAAAARRALAVSDKGTVGSSRGSGGGDGGGKGKTKDKKTKAKSKEKEKEQEDTAPKALEALVVGGNFTLNGKSTNVAQYDPVRWVVGVEGDVCQDRWLVASVRTIFFSVCFLKEGRRPTHMRHIGRALAHGGSRGA